MKRVIPRRHDQRDSVRLRKDEAPARKLGERGGDALPAGPAADMADRVATFLADDPDFTHVGFEIAFVEVFLERLENRRFFLHDRVVKLSERCFSKSDIAGCVGQKILALRGDDSFKIHGTDPPSWGSAGKPRGDKLGADSIDQLTELFCTVNLRYGVEGIGFP